MIIGSQANHDLSPDIPVPALSFDEAWLLARNGLSYVAVVDAMRFELRKIERSASKSALLNLKINVAVAMLECGNHSPIYDVYDSLYKESQSLLESVLRVEPSHKIAQENLAAVRQSRAVKKRAARAEKQELLQQHTEKISIPGSFESYDIDVQVAHLVQTFILASFPQIRSRILRLCA
jgi:hypothetical protein